MDNDRSEVEAGTLYMVATPIGNLADITLRALELLKTVDVIAAEDTRHTRKLLSHYHISGKLLSCHEHNEAERARDLTARLSSGQSVALLTDAGTPAVSDPGYRVLEAAIAAGIRVVPIPGPSAAVAALSASGLASDAFFFVGFLPQKGARRSSRLKQLADVTATLIFYESPHRVVPLLRDISRILGERRVVAAREMTKRYEEFIRGAASEVADILAGRPAVKGELTILVAGRTEGAHQQEAAEDLEALLREAVQAALKEGGPGASRLSRDLSKRFGVPKNRVYELILELQSQSGAQKEDARGKGDISNGGET